MIGVINVVVLEVGHTQRDTCTQGLLVVTEKGPMIRGRNDRVIESPEIAQGAACSEGRTLNAPVFLLNEAP